MNPNEFEDEVSAPAFVVMMRIVFLKSTTRPNESVKRPSSMIWSSIL